MRVQESRRTSRGSVRSALSQADSQTLALAAYKSLQSTLYGYSNQLIQIQMSNSLQSLLEQLKNAPKINLLDMYIADDGARLVASYIQRNKNLKQLILKGNNISAVGFVEIFTALRACPLIKVLSCDWNIMGSEGAALEALGVFLVSNKSLQHIGLSNNKLTADHIDAFANALRQNSTLLSLDLRWNELGKRGGQILAAAIRDNKALLYVDVNGNDFAPPDVQAIEDTLEQHRASNPIRKERIQEVDDEVVQEEEPMGTGFVGPSVVQHLEQMLEQERIHTLQIKQRMERELDELGRRDKADTRLLEELDGKSRQLEADNRAAQYQIEKLRDEYQLMERQQEDVVRSMEEKIRNNEFILNELEKKHRSNLDRALNENNFRIRDLNRDWDNRCRAVEERSRQLEQENRLLEEELRQLQERQIQLQLTYDQELRDLGRRVQEEEYQKYHAVAVTLDAKIRAMEEARDLVIKRNLESAKDYDIRLSESKTDQQIMFEELERLKIQNKEFIRQSAELRQKCDSLKQQAKVKEGAVEKYESEINQLNAQIEQKRKLQAEQLTALLNEQKADRQIWERERIQGQERVHALERTLRESHADNARLRQEYQKLSEILQFNVSKALHQTFSENQYF